MREAGKIVMRALLEVKERVRPGISTVELDRVAAKCIRKSGGIAAFKGYRGFPATICASINEQVVHGIPSVRRLSEGDIISVDVGVLKGGYYADAAMTFPVGKVSETARLLMEVTRIALEKGIEQAQEGNYLGDISHAIQTYVEKHGFFVVREYVGHGIGKQMHEEPQVPNFGTPKTGPVLRPGMTLAIEPMVNAGTSDVELLGDGWTVVTKDGSLSAHFEHTVAITDEGPIVLTACSE